MSEIKNDIVGKTVQGYHIIKFLGSGKFSTVYQAEHESDHQIVAMKVIKVNKKANSRFLILLTLSNEKNACKRLTSSALLTIRIS